MEASVSIIKADGARVPFSREKFEQSLMRSGASAHTAAQVMEAIEPAIYDGMSTKELYRLAHDFLQEHKPAVAGRYQLKRAIMALGPTGYPFERYIGTLLAAQGYAVQVDQQVPGKCVMHEVDVIATKEHHTRYVECKFHNEPGVRSALQTPLYVKARYDDIVDRVHGVHTMQGRTYHDCWLITNTRLTSIALDYARCVGMSVLAWDFPANEGLARIIDHYKFYPVTCLSNIPHKVMLELIAHNVVLACDVPAHVGLLERMQLGKHRIEHIVAECRVLCGQAD